MRKQAALCIDRSYERRRQIGAGLESLQLKVHMASSVFAGKRLIYKHYYNVVLVSFETVGKEVFELCSSIRKANSTAVMIVLMESVNPGAEEKLFDCGVSDVVVGRQACARLLKKRVQTRMNPAGAAKPNHTILKFKDTVVDLSRREVWCNGTLRPLPGILADLLKYFVDNPNRAISRDELQRCTIWADSICTPANEGGKTFDVNVGKLRKIIEPDPARPQIIQAVRGVGWKLAKKCVVEPG